MTVAVITPGVAERLPGIWCASLPVQRASAAGDLPDPATMIDPSWTLDNLKDEPVAAGYRRVSWALGIDPTKHRPSGEALARRVLGGKPFPQIHPLVDAYNRASAATLVPLSAYDLDRLRPPITVRPAHADEPFHGIARDPEHIEAGRIVYVDDGGTVMGVSLWRDAVATVVRPETERALLFAVGAAPLDVEVGIVALKQAAALAARVGFAAQGEPVVSRA